MFDFRFDVEALLVMLILSPIVYLVYGGAFGMMEHTKTPHRTMLVAKSLTLLLYVPGYLALAHEREMFEIELLTAFSVTMTTYIGFMFGSTVLECVYTIRQPAHQQHRSVILKYLFFPSLKWETILIVVVGVFSDSRWEALNGNVIGLLIGMIWVLLMPLDEVSAITVADALRKQSKAEGKK